MLFKSWRSVSDEWARERILSNNRDFEKERRVEVLEQWDKKVDALKLYMA